MSNMDFSQLEGRWFQTHATWGTDYFGCVWTEYRNSVNSSFGLDAYWTETKAFFTPMD